MDNKKTKQKHKRKPKYPMEPVPDKVTWNMIYADFLFHYPHWKERVLRWIPIDVLTIKIYFTEKQYGVYQYFGHKMTLTDDPSIHR